jgi:sarcosine oxidase
MAWDAIILGCGTMGSAAAYELSRTGRRVLALDRAAPPHDLGSHHGRVRMFRTSYYEHPAYIPWLRRSLDAWRSMGSQFGAPLIETCGALYMGRPDSELISGCLLAIETHGLEHERLTSAELRARFPLFDLPADYVGLLEKDAGFIYCERAVEAMIALAKRRGAEVRPNAAALTWKSDGERVLVRTHSGEHAAKNLVICAGAWAGEVLRDIGIRLEVTRQVQGWLTPADPGPFLRLPCWAIDPGDGSLFYGFPALSLDGAAEVKLARHAPSTPTTAAGVDRSARADEAEDFMPLVRRYLPSLAAAPVRTSVCLYTNSPDGHYLIDRHPRHANVVFGAGFSGHGFKAAPAVAELIGSLLQRHDHPEPFFALSRLT